MSYCVLPENVYPSPIKLNIFLSLFFVLLSPPYLSGNYNPWEGRGEGGEEYNIFPGIAHVQMSRTLTHTFVHDVISILMVSFL